VLLFIIALPTGNGDKDAGTEPEEMQQDASRDGEPGEIPGQDLAGENHTDEAYAAAMETRLEEILEGMSGVGEAEVMITLEASGELVVEKDVPSLRSDVREEDSEGGSRMSSQQEQSETTVYSTLDGESQPYVVKRILPRVQGVLVVAEGAGTGAVARTVTEVVQALFDVEAHRVKVVKGMAGDPAE